MRALFAYRLFLSAPRTVSKGSGTKALVELVDLYPTLVDLAGLPEPAHVAGRSLRPLMDDPERPGRTGALTVGWSRAAWMHAEMGGRRVMGYSVRFQPVPLHGMG